MFRKNTAPSYHPHYARSALIENLLLVGQYVWCFISEHCLSVKDHLFSFVFFFRFRRQHPKTTYREPQRRFPDQWRHRPTSLPSRHGPSHPARPSLRRTRKSAPTQTGRGWRRRGLPTQTAEYSGILGGRRRGAAVGSLCSVPRPPWPCYVCSLGWEACYHGSN